MSMLMFWRVSSWSTDVSADSDIRQNEKTFIEILYFSPMSRAGLAIDKILR
jgi:hypothetical protein